MGGRRRLDGKGLWRGLRRARLSVSLEQRGNMGEAYTESSNQNVHLSICGFGNGKGVRIA